MGISVIGASASAGASSTKTQEFAASGFWTKPQGVNEVKVTACGGGGNPNTAGYGVGQNGAYISRTIDISSYADGASIPVVIGAGATTQNGSGGTTEFASVRAPGGTGETQAMPDAFELDSAGASFFGARRADTQPNQYYHYAYHSGYKVRYIGAANYSGIVTTAPDGTVRSNQNSSGTSPGTGYMYAANGPLDVELFVSSSGRMFLSGLQRSSSYGTTAYGSVLYSDDEGLNWYFSPVDTVANVISNGNGTKELRVIEENGVLFLLARMYNSTNNYANKSHIAYSTNNGNSWSILAPGAWYNYANSQTGTYGTNDSYGLGVKYNAAEDVYYYFWADRYSYWYWAVYSLRSSSSDLATATWGNGNHEFSNGQSYGSFYAWTNQAKGNMVFEKSDGSYVMALSGPGQQQNSSGYWNFSYHTFTPNGSTGTWTSSFSGVNQHATNNGNIQILGMLNDNVICGVSYYDGSSTYRTFLATGNTIVTYRNNSWQHALFTVSSTTTLDIASQSSDSLITGPQYNSNGQYWEYEPANVFQGRQAPNLGNLGGTMGAGGITRTIGGGNSTRVYQTGAGSPEGWCEGQVANNSYQTFLYSYEPGCGGHNNSGGVVVENAQDGRVILEWSE